MEDIILEEERAETQVRRRPNLQDQLLAATLFRAAS